MAHMVILAARWQLVSTSNIGQVVDKCHNFFDQVDITWVIAYKASEEKIVVTNGLRWIITALVLNKETRHHELDSNCGLR